MNWCIRSGDRTTPQSLRDSSPYTGAPGKEVVNMKIIKAVQIILFVLLVGITGTWTNGEIADAQYIIEALAIVGGMVFLHIIKITARERSRKRMLKRYQMYTFGTQLSKARRMR